MARNWCVELQRLAHASQGGGVRTLTQVSRVVEQPTLPDALLHFKTGADQKCQG